MSVADNLKEAFSGTRGKVLIVGGIAVVGYLWWTRGRGGIGTPTEELVPDTSSAGRTPQTDPSVGNDTQTDGNAGRPTTNLGWLAQGVDVLVARSTPAGVAYNALSRALGGEPTTTQEQSLVSQVIAVLGSPPEGMPPLVNAPPTTPGGGGDRPGGNAPDYTGPARRKPSNPWHKVVNSNWIATMRNFYSNLPPEGSAQEYLMLGALMARNATHPHVRGKTVYLPAELHANGTWKG